MLLQRAEKLPEDGIWLYELKLDGFRAEAIKSGGRVRFTSRNDRDFNAKYPAIVHALHAMPDETVIDGEIVASTNGENSLMCRPCEKKRAACMLVFSILNINAISLRRKWPPSRA